MVDEAVSASSPCQDEDQERQRREIALLMKQVEELVGELNSHTDVQEQLIRERKTRGRW